MRFLVFIGLCVLSAACNPQTKERARTGDADIKVTDKLIDCAVQKRTSEVIDFLNTPSGTEEELESMKGLLKLISKECTDDSIINTDVVEMRYRLKQKLN
jgi:predicted nuclease of restriction endonuclease-like RecB superfamily